MKTVYKGKNDTFEYFICNIQENQNEEYSCFPEDIKIISSNAFQNSKVKIIKLGKNIETIEKSAFENCSELELVYCAKTKEDDSKKDSPIENIEILDSSDFTIQANAFKNCEKLTTVIFPKITKKLIIEKNAFVGCESLRTVVLLTDDNAKICFTENPFEDCPEYLTFICRKKSDIAKFARENEFRSIYVD